MIDEVRYHKEDDKIIVDFVKDEKTINSMETKHTALNYIIMGELESHGVKVVNLDNQT